MAAFNQCVIRTGENFEHMLTYSVRYVQLIGLLASYPALPTMNALPTMSDAVRYKLAFSFMNDKIIS